MTREQISVFLRKAHEALSYSLQHEGGLEPRNFTSDERKSCYNILRQRLQFLAYQISDLERQLQISDSVGYVDLNTLRLRVYFLSAALWAAHFISLEELEAYGIKI